MKDKNKDVIKICKGFYDNEKHKDTLSALKAYTGEKCGLIEKYVNHKEVLDYCLLSVAEKYFTTKEWLTMMRSRMWQEDILYQAMFNKTTILLDGDYICNLLIRQIVSIQIKDDNNNWLVDLSDYNNENII